LARHGSIADPVVVSGGSVYYDEAGVQLTVKRAVIAAASSGDNTLVAAVTGKKIRVVQAVLLAAGAVTVRFESGAGGTALTGAMSNADTTGIVLPLSPAGWFETAAGALLNLELSAGVSVAGVLAYVEV
jgi:hypothetical protein